MALLSKQKVKTYNWGNKVGVVLGAQVTVSDKQLQVWICKNGESVFRLKVIGGEIHLTEYDNGKQVEVMITREKKK